MHVPSKLGERTGFQIHQMDIRISKEFVWTPACSAVANALSIPYGEWGVRSQE